MPEPLDKLRKRVFFRCHHTGMKENDLLFGAFAERHLGSMSDEDVARFESLLMDNNDIDLHNWVVGRKPLPTELDHPVMHMILNFKYVQ